MLVSPLSMPTADHETPKKMNRQRVHALTHWMLTSWCELKDVDPLDEVASVFARRTLAPRLGFLPMPGGFFNKQGPSGSGGFPGKACKGEVQGKRGHG